MREWIWFCVFALIIIGFVAVMCSAPGVSTSAELAVYNADGKCVIFQQILDGSTDLERVPGGIWLTWRTMNGTKGGILLRPGYRSETRPRGRGK